MNMALGDEEGVKTAFMQKIDTILPLYSRRILFLFGMIMLFLMEVIILGRYFTNHSLGL